MSNLNNIKLSPALITLYGEEEAVKVAARCYEVDAFFGQWVNEQIYGVLWELPPLNFYEKSLITVIALIVLGREEQLQIHLKGLLNLGKSPIFILQLVNVLLENKYIINSDNAINSLASITKLKHPLPEALRDSNLSAASSEDTLSSRELSFIKLSVFIAKADKEELNNIIETYLSSKILSEEEIRGVCRHLMTYCGCPPVMQTLGILTNISSNN